MRYDLLRAGGTLVDPAQSYHDIADVAFAGGCVAAIGRGLPREAADAVVDCAGRIVAPGLIDLHVHVFWGVSYLGIAADPHCIARGVTTAVDAGSAGADTFAGFRKYVIEASDTRLFAQLNIAAQGMLSAEIGELDDLRYANVPRALATIEQNRDVILGIKVRLTRDSIDDIVALLRANDILTHCFHGSSHGILDERGRVRDSVRAAIERGVVFDVGHGAGSFSWAVAEQALAQDIQPQTISSDLHVYNVNGPVYDLATTASKFLQLGLRLDQVIAKVTAAPAQAIGMADHIGTLAVGALGDAVVFRLDEGHFSLIDSHGQERVGQQRLVPALVVRAGKVYSDNVRPKQDSYSAEQID